MRLRQTLDWDLEMVRAGVWVGLQSLILVETAVWICGESVH